MSLADDVLTRIDKELEQARLERLAQLQADPASELAPFTSDGCSGGMSDGWHYMAHLFPDFKQHFGDQPPWQDCCVQHDKLYWRGETDNGYEKRLAADRGLQRCVVNVGRARSTELAKEYDLDAEQVQQGFEIAAQLMYRAVRLGGRPCTVFPWRWGYGWPQCPWTAEEGE